MRDVWEDPEAQAWREAMNNGLRPMIADSVVTMMISPGDEPDAKIAVELGFSILFDKPILVLAPPDRGVPDKLRSIADAVIIGTPADPHVRAAIEAFIAEHGGK
jgi:hypothetical protein